MGSQNRTEQEEFWSGEFGDAYLDRSQDAALVPPRVALFSRILGRTRRVESVFELGANVGLNLLAIRTLLPRASYKALEINRKAVEVLRRHGWIEAEHGSLLDCRAQGVADFVLTSGVLIHVHPDELPRAYEALYAASRRYVCVCEYFNPSPVEVVYRGHSARLFKRDFAGEMLDRFSDLRLVDYGFVYRRDPNFALDDVTWFLMEKVPR